MGDVVTLNEILSDVALKSLVQAQTKIDEKSATNSERQTIKAQSKKNKRKRIKK